MSTQPTIVAELTPPGTGAIAVIMLHGPRAWDIVRAWFTPASGKPLPPEMLPANELRFGRFGPVGNADEVVLAVRSAAAGSWLELQCHGGRTNVDWLLERLEQHGASRRHWSEFMARIHPRWPALAAIQLAHAPTMRTAAILLEQHLGAFDRELARIERLMTHGEIAAALQQAQDLLRLAAFGRHLVEPWRVVIAGAPNVGKSSLLNALVGFDRCIVAPIAGTTRDVVSITTALSGWPVEFSDTAGLRHADDALERSSMVLTHRVLQSADLCIWVLDAQAPVPVWPAVAVDNSIVVINKCDLPPAWDFSTAPGAVCVSARTGAGVAGLGECIADRLVPQPPPPGAAVPFHSECSDLLQQLTGQLTAGDTVGAAGLMHSAAAHDPYVSYK